MPRKKAVLTKSEVSRFRKGQSAFDDVEIEEFEGGDDEDNYAPNSPPARRAQTHPGRGLPHPERLGAPPVSAKRSPGRPKKAEAPKGKKAAKAPAPKPVKPDSYTSRKLDRFIAASKIAKHHNLPAEAATHMARTFSDADLIRAEHELFSGVTKPEPYDRRLIDRDVSEVSWNRDGGGGIELGGVERGNGMTPDNIASKFSTLDAKHEVLANKYRSLEQQVIELYSHFKAGSHGYGV